MICVLFILNFKYVEDRNIIYKNLNEYNHTIIFSKMINEFKFPFII